MRASPPVHRSTRITFHDGSVSAEVWFSTSEPCLWCGSSRGQWASLPTNAGYRICLSCRRGWEPEQCTWHTPANNDVFAQLVEQLARAPRGRDG